MDGDARLNIGGGPGRVNATYPQPRQRRIPSPEYIEISSSSSFFDSDEDEDPAQPDHYMNPVVQEQFSSEAEPRRQPSSLSTPDQMSNRVVPPAQPGFDDPAIDPAIQQGEAYLNNGFGHFDDLDIQDQDLTHLMEEQFRAEMAARVRDDGNQLALGHQVAEQPLAVVDTKGGCLDQIQAMFPGICAQHVSDLYDTVSNQTEEIVAHILEAVEKGSPYPRSRDTKKTQKRKRELDEDEEAARDYSAADRPPNTDSGLQRNIRTILSVEFPDTPMTFIDACLRQNGHRMFATYRILEEAERTYGLEDPPYNRIKTKRKMPVEYQEDNLADFINADPEDNDRHSMLREFQAARRVRKNAEAKREEERRLEREEQANLEKAQADGTMAECQCCFGDYPMNRMITCDNEESLHMFCKDCAKQNAETVIGQSKYELVCMAMEGCTASFSKKQQDRFLDKKTQIALERNLLEANLRMAGIEDLASCPFCPNAAQYPPVEVDKEFRCDAEDCGKVSCRLCKLESHIPKSCEEHSKDIGLSVRRQIEEAMSEALIRKCNKCGTPFVKEEGCNKMTCTRPGCHNVQCYVCSKSCNYSHFNDESRGGKAGNCPLFEKTSQRHEDEVKKAETEALKRIRTEHPEFTEEDLTIHVSNAVLEDEQRRQARESNGPPDPLALLRAANPHLEMHNRMELNQDPARLGYDMYHHPAGARPHLRDPLNGGIEGLGEDLGVPNNDVVFPGAGGVPARPNLQPAVPAPRIRMFPQLVNVPRELNGIYGHNDPVYILAEGPVDRHPLPGNAAQDAVQPAVGNQGPHANQNPGPGEPGYIQHPYMIGIDDFIAQGYGHRGLANVHPAPVWPAQNADALVPGPANLIQPQNVADLRRRLGE